MASRTRLMVALVLVLLGFLPALAYQNHVDLSPVPSTKKRVVYVCACLKTKSCPCMTEAKSAGPCACGTEGSPPMKAVPADSDWASEVSQESHVSELTV